jgi:hypothetical protein
MLRASTIQNSSSLSISYMNHLPTTWVIPHPDVQLIKRGNVYYAKPVSDKPAKPPQSRPKARKSPKKTS